MRIDNDVRAPHRDAVRYSLELVAQVTPAELGAPTPCAGWDLGDLLIHMTVQHRGFAAAARGRGAEPAGWDPASVADAVRAQPARSYAAAAEDVLAAFAADGVLDAPFALPEFGTGAVFPGSLAIQFHFVDYVVHGWDVARALGVPFRLSDDVLAAAAPVALAVPDGDIRSTAGAPFAPALTGDGDTLDRILRHLGRSPQWTP